MGLKNLRLDTVKGEKMKATNIKKSLALILGSVLAFGAISFAGCSTGESGSTDKIPQLPDYSARAKEYDFFAYSGPMNGVIGADAQSVIERMRTKIPTFFRVADGEPKIHGALFDLNTDTGKVRSVRRITF